MLLLLLVLDPAGWMLVACKVGLRIGGNSERSVEFGHWPSVPSQNNYVNSIVLSVQVSHNYYCKYYFTDCQLLFLHCTRSLRVFVNYYLDLYKAAEWIQ